jgi:hypothetical protein
VPTRPIGRSRFIELLFNAAKDRCKTTFAAMIRDRFVSVVKR